MFTTPRAYSYIRMSRPEQLRGDSLRRQLEASQRYANEHGLELDDTLRDLGLSAYSGAHRSRGALGGFLVLVERGEVPAGSVLIVESLDRLSREAVLDALTQFSAIIKAGITIVTLADGMTYSRATLDANVGALLMSLTIMARAHEESAMKAKRLSAAWDNKRKRAAAEGTAMTARCPAWIRIGAAGGYELIPERAAVVHRIHEDTAAGIGKNVLTKRLNAEAVPTFGKSAGWQISYIQKILESEAVYGRYQPHRKIAGRRVPEGDPIDAYFPAAVPESLFCQSKAAREARRAKGGRKGTGYTNVLSGLCRCAACGRVMSTVNKGAPPKGGRYLLCDSVRRGLGCSNTRRWRLTDAEALILDRLTRVDMTRVLGGRNDAAKNARVAVETARQRLADAEQRRERLLDLVEAGDDAAGARVRSLADKIKQFKTELKSAEAEAALLTHSPTDLIGRQAAVADLRRRMSEASGDDLFTLRATLAQELRRVLRRLAFSADGGVSAFYAVPGPGKPSRLATSLGVGHPLVLADGDHEQAADLEEYAQSAPWRKRGA